MQYCNMNHVKGVTPIMLYCCINWGSSLRHYHVCSTRVFLLWYTTCPYLYVQASRVMKEDMTIMLIMFLSVALYCSGTLLPGLLNPILFCKEHIIPSCAAYSYFACFLKTEQRKCRCVCNAILRAQCCHCFDVHLNSSMSRGSFEGLTENHWKKTSLWGEKNKNEALKFCTRGEGERRGSFEPVGCQSFSVFVWGDEWEFPVPPPCYRSPESGQIHCTGWRKVEFVDFEREKKYTLLLNFHNSNIHNSRTSAERAWE